MKKYNRYLVPMITLILLAGIGCYLVDLNADNGRSALTRTEALISGPLGSYNVDISQSSVSGLSAGGYMAGQFLVAFSDTVVGAGVFGSGPYECSRGNLPRALGSCMSHMPPITSSDIDQSYQTAKEYVNKHAIDELENLENRRVYIFSGTVDETVVPEVTDWVDNWFEKAGMPASHIHYENGIAAGHSIPTMDYGNPCSTKKAPPWMADCDYDGAGAVLEHIYGNLDPKSPVTETSGAIIEFPQKDFFHPQDLTANQLKERFSFNEFGYAYVPKACQNGELCRIHVVFHGCKQIYNRNPNALPSAPDDDSDPFGLQMVENAGYNEWANNNNLIILYPQAQKTGGTSKIDTPGNPNGCFDWWGYINGTDNTYATKEGPQMAAVYAMMERLAGAPSAEFDEAGQEATDLVIKGTVSDGNDDIEGLEVEFTYDGNQSTGKTAVDVFEKTTGRFEHSEPWPQDRTGYRVQLWVTYTNQPSYELKGPEIKVGNTCTDWTETNETHRLEERAVSCWFWYNCAKGSKDFLGLNGTTTTVRKEDPENDFYNLGACSQ